VADSSLSRYSFLVRRRGQSRSAGIGRRSHRQSQMARSRRPLDRFYAGHRYTVHVGEYGRIRLLSAWTHRFSKFSEQIKRNRTNRSV
jgi:hypothetical protein